MKTENLPNQRFVSNESKMTLTDILNMAKYYSLLVGALAVLGYILLLVE